ncbi:MAG: DUF309 domain-containing protein [Candidatus Nitrosoabyssus spongiisocia]|nr:MAG: DUF309 domain-containing protein [Nitrosopumilaceae archaeon AB1(1)]
MERYMLHLVNKTFTPQDTLSLLQMARKLNPHPGIMIRDCRVASKCLEFDVSIPDGTIESLIIGLKSIGSLDNSRLIIECDMEKDSAIQDAKYYFNNERFWECHEALEWVWNHSTGIEKTTVQGIILVAAAFVHYQKAENDICISIFNRALEKFVNSPVIYEGINIDVMKKLVTNMIHSEISTFQI